MNKGKIRKCRKYETPKRQKSEPKGVQNEKGKIWKIVLKKRERSPPKKKREILVEFPLKR